MIKTILLGNIGKGAELAYTKNNLEYSKFSVAVTKKVKGEKVTQWVNCTIFGKRATALTQYLQKGSKVYVEGDPTINVWTDKNGKTNADFSLVVADVQLIGDGPKRDNYAQDDKPTESFDSIPSQVTLMTEEDVPF